MDESPSKISTCTKEQMAAIITLMPQKDPFLFIDEITEISDQHIVAQRTFRGEEFFYKGHFPGNPVTPGVILVETMAQAALVALGIYLVTKEQPTITVQTLFSECAIEFLEVVRPGDTVTVRGERSFWRRNKLKSNVELILGNGRIAAAGTVSGVGVTT